MKKILAILRKQNQRLQREDKKQREINEQWDKAVEKRQAKERAQFNKELEDQIKEEELEDYNKKHETNFKTSADLQNEKLKIKKAETAKKEKLLEKERLQEEERLAKEEKAAATEPSGGGSLTGKITRLKRLYKSGTLTKAEFEKAKNNLLK